MKDRRFENRVKGHLVRLLALTGVIAFCFSGSLALDINSSKSLQYYGKGNLDFEVLINGKINAFNNLNMGGNNITNVDEIKCSDGGCVPAGTVEDIWVNESGDTMYPALNITNLTSGNKVAQFKENQIRFYQPLSVEASGGLSVTNGIDLTDTVSNTIDSYSTFYLKTSSGSPTDIVLQPTGVVGVQSNLNLGGNNITNVDELKCSDGSCVEAENIEDIWVDEAGDTMSGPLDMSGNNINNPNVVDGTNYVQGDSGQDIEFSTDIILRDTSNNHILEAKDGGNVEIPNGQLLLTPGGTDLDGVIEENGVSNSDWSFEFTTSSEGNDNPSGFWVDSNGEPDMRLRGTGSTVVNLINTNGDSYLNGGNVGIGTTNPAEELHVKGDWPQIFVEGTSNDASIRFDIPDSNNQWSIGTGAGAADTNEFGLTLYNSSNNNNLRTALWVEESGQVGIGVDNPNAKLDVGGNLDMNGNTINMADGNIHYLHELEMQDWDSDAGGADNSVRLLRRDDNWMFYNGGFVIGSYSNNNLGDIGDGNLLTEGDINIAGGNLYDGTGTSNFFENSCSDNEHITGISSAGAISCGSDSGDISKVAAGNDIDVSGGSSGTATVSLENDIDVNKIHSASKDIKLNFDQNADWIEVEDGDSTTREDIVVGRIYLDDNVGWFDGSGDNIQDNTLDNSEIQNGKNFRFNKLYLSSKIEEIGGKGSNNIGDDGDLYFDSDDRIEFQDSGSTYMEIGASPSEGNIQIDSSGKITAKDNDAKLRLETDNDPSNYFAQFKIDYDYNNPFTMTSYKGFHVLEVDDGKDIAIGRDGWKVGVGKTDPTRQLDVNGGAYIRGQLDISGKLKVHGADFVLDGRSGNGERALVDNNEELVVNYGQDYSNGVKIKGNVYFPNIPTQDISEAIKINKGVEKGDTVVISDKEDSKVKRTDEPYAMDVAGVISTDPAIYMKGEQGGLVFTGKNDSKSNRVITETENGKKAPLALAGRVPVKVTTKNGPIERGDRIVSSSKPGYGMKCEIWLPSEHTGKKIRNIVNHNEKCMGATVGKALEPLKEGKGKITVLVG